MGVLEKFCYDTRDRLTKGVQVSNVGGWQSSNVKNSNQSEFKKLKQKIIEASIKYHKYVKFKQSVSQELSNIWVNINGKWHSNEYHNHAGASISGTYYITEGSNIVFKHPLNYLNLFFWKKEVLEEYSTTNSSTYTFSPKPNTLLLFPPWIEHKVKVNDTEKDRISIAFNMVFKNV